MIERVASAGDLQLSADIEPLDGLGLTSIAERARMMAGTLTIDAAPGEGTTLNVRLPAGAQSKS